ncbi:TOBE domain-containing protein [Sagittula salina]
MPDPAPATGVTEAAAPAPVRTPDAPQASASTPTAATQPPAIPPGGLEIHWHAGQPPLVASNGPEALAGRNVVLSLRPEKISISKERPTAANVLQGKVIDIAYLGNISTYYVKLADGTMVKAQAANTRRISRRGITWEDTVWLSFTATAGVVLEDDT